MLQNESFVQVPYRNGLLHEYNGTKVHGLIDQLFENSSGFSVFGFQVLGRSVIEYKTGSNYNVSQGQYFAFADADAKIVNRSGFTMLIIVPNYNVPFQLGGTIEEKGRLKYIDGCTDSLLISPVKKGDPCFNHLHFPPGINQTMHTHPSVRIGVVVNGHGECVTPFGNMPLVQGNVFLILPEGEIAKGLDGADHLSGSHCFRTFEESMDVIAFHPDSDFGPEDENHPMINRTIVDGISAAALTHLHTQ